MHKFLLLSLLSPIVAHAMGLRILARNRTLSYMVEYFVTAGEPFEVHIANATEVGSGYPDQTTTHLKIGIFSTIYNAWMCSLTDLIPARDGTIELTIPPQTGPSGAYYALSAYGFPSNASPFLGDSIIRSGVTSGTNYFYLSDGLGAWTPAETQDALLLEGLVGFWNADIPCASYPCAQDCARRQMPSASAWRNGTVWSDCVASCPGVGLDYDRIYGGGEWTGIVTSTPTETEAIQGSTALPTPTGTCVLEEYETPCGSGCCGSFEYCARWSACADLPFDVDLYKASQSTGAPKATSTKTSQNGPQETGAAALVGVDWRVLGLGIAAGAFAARAAE